MPNWKKVVVSGSNAVLNHITASGNISASGTITANVFIGDGSSLSGVTTFSSATVSGSFTAASASFSTRVTANDAKATANTSNVTSAGALMDSEVTSLALIKSITAATISGSSNSLSSSIASDVATNTAKATANTSNVTSAGALMDSEVTSLALIKGLTAATISGSSNSLSSSVASDVATNTAKLTANTSNVTSAGALMDSEVTSLALIKGLTAATISGSSNSLSSSIASDVATNTAKATANTSNVTSAGALMDSEVTSLALIKSLTAATISGSSNSLSSSVASDVATNTAKLTANTSNVTSAGALMDSELSDLAAVKAINQGLTTTSNVTFGGITAASLNVTHLTSSFITSSTIQTEGSNLFGDAINDTQFFNGHITASGNISASGGIQTGFGRFNGSSDIVTDAAIVIPENKAIYTLDSTGTHLRKLLRKADDIIEVGQSGTALIDEIRFLPGNAGFTTFYGDTTEVARVDIAGNITASGNISASGNLSVKNLDNVDSINAGTSTLGNLDFTTQGTVNLRASNSTTHGLNLFGGVNGSAPPHIGTITHQFLEFNVGSTDNLLVLAGAADPSTTGMLAGEARFIGHISASSVSASGDVYGNKFYGDGSGLTGVTSFSSATVSGSFTSLSSSIASDVATNTAKATANTSNVTSAGALMDSEVTSLALIKGLTAATISGSSNSLSSSIASDVATNTAKATANTSNVTSAGALMDTEVTSLALIKGLTAATISGSISATSVAAAGALMDSEMTDLAGVKGVTISNLQSKPSEGAFANGDKTKLDGISTSADVTDSTTVAAAGALMDSEVTSLALIKGLTAATISGSLSATSVAAAGALMDSEIASLALIKSITAATISGSSTSLSSSIASDVATNTAKLTANTSNVTSAGALMDSEVTNLAQVKAFDSSDYATAAQGVRADNALAKTGGAMTGAITTNSTFDGRDVATDGTKLDTIETNADVTDTANVTAAGALMDSEISSLSSVKAIDQDLDTNADVVFEGINCSEIVNSGATSLGNSSNDTFDIVGNITSSGNISSSGTVQGLTGSFSALVGDTSQATSLEVAGPITASGGIISDNIESFWTSFNCDGDGDFANSSYGPNTQGINYYLWNRNWTSTTADGGDPTGDHVHRTEINTGWYVPYKIKVVGFCGGLHDGNSASTTTCTVKLFNTVASLKGSDYDSNSGTTKALVASSGNVTLNGNRWKNFDVSGLSVTLSEGMYVLPRITMGENLTNLRGQFTIKYKRVV